MSWSFTPAAALLMVPGLLALIVAFIAWKHREQPAARWLVVLTLGGAVWSLGHAGEILGADHFTKLFWAKAQYLGGVVMPIAWAATGLQYAGRGAWLSRRKLVWLAVLPAAVALGLVWTNGWHGLVWRETHIADAGPFTVLGVTHGPAFWMWMVYVYCVLAFGTVLLFSRILRSKDFYLGQRVVLLLAMVFPWAANVLYVFKLGPGFDMTSFAFTLSGIILAHGLLRLHLVDIVPLARDFVLEMMADGVFVLDRHDRIVDLNPKARAMLPPRAAKVIGARLDDLLPDRKRLSEALGSDDEAHFELELEQHGQLRTFDVHLSLLQDRQGTKAGRLLVCMDITGRKRAEKESSIRTGIRGLIADISASFVAAPPEELKEQLEESLHRIGRLTQADCCWIITSDGTVIKVADTFVWTAEGVEVDVRLAEEISLRHFEWAIDVLGQDDALFIPRVADLAPEAAAERRLLEIWRVQSCFIVPLSYSRKERTLTGLIGLFGIREEKHWGETTINLLRAAGEIMVNAFLRSQAEVALRKRQEILSEAQRIAHLGNWEWDLIKDTIWASEEAYHIFGLDEGEFDGTLEAFLRLAHPGDRDRIQQVTEESLARKKPSNFDCRIIRPDGAVRVLYVQASMDYDEAGEPVRVAGTVLDITERKKAEEALRLSEENYRNLTDLLPLTVFECDLRGRFTFVNDAATRFFGFSREEIVGTRSVEDVVVPEHRERAKRTLMQSLDPAQENRGGTEYLMLRKDGSTFPCLVSTTRVVQDGRVVGLRGIALDITERKQAEEERRQLEFQLQHSQKLESLGVLAGGIAHDFNNILLGILGNAELIRIQTLTSPKGMEYLENVVKSAQRAADLCTQLLAYSGKGKFLVKAEDVTTLVEDMAHLLEISISKKHRLEYDFKRDLPPIEADAGQLRQIVMNLIMNASDAIGNTDGMIGLRTGLTHCDSAYLGGTYLDDELPEGEYVYMEVTDSGEGMDRARQQRIFDPFYTTKSKGRGLGLAAVLGIIRGHNGAIELTSGPGEGTRVRVLFPAAPDAVETTVPAARPKDDLHSTGTILVVDDEQMVRDFCREALELAGMQVMTAPDGRVALDIYSKHGGDIDAVVLDMTMPRLNGEETLRGLLDIRGDVRVILSSGYSEEEATSRFNGRGFSAFLHKPYHPRELVHLVQRVISTQ